MRLSKNGVRKMDAQTKAINELEAIFSTAGWANGRKFLTDEQIQAAAAPIFYRTATHSAAALARITKGIPPQSAMLYMIYNNIGDNETGADNRAYLKAPRFALTMYYDVPNLLDDLPDNPFAEYFTKLKERLESNLWAVENSGEAAVNVTGYGLPYCHRKILYVQKLFI